MDWMKYKKIYFSISGIFIVTGIISVLLWGFKIGIDFKGGAVAEYKLATGISTEGLTNLLKDNNIAITSIQETGNKTYIFKLNALNEEEKKRFEDVIHTASNNEAEQLQFVSVGPSIGPELVKKTLYALLIASVGILLWIAYQFKSIRFGACAVLAMLHDTFIVIGAFSIFGHFLGAEIDFLFATAVLTVLSFSVHDTIVVYDRIRELQRKSKTDIYNLANAAVTETLTRSFNNSITIIFMLLALVLLGGTTIQWFALALLIGTIAGTYSSPFVAVPLLVSWESVIANLRQPFTRK